MIPSVTEAHRAVHPSADCVRVGQHVGSARLSGLHFARRPNMPTRFVTQLMLIAFVACGSHAFAAARERLQGIVVHVADGDSFVLRSAPPGGRVRQTRVRIVAIDAPEAAQPHHRSAGALLRRLILRRAVSVDGVAHDRYGRLAATVSVDGRDAGLAMLRSGLAWYAPAHAAELQPGDRGLYRDAEAAARRARVGLWADADPVPPWQYRRDHPRGRWSAARDRSGLRVPR